MLISDMSHSTRAKLLYQLKALSERSLNNPYNKLAVQDLLQRAFDDEKPLFSVIDKPQAAALVENAIPILERAFVDIHGSMNPDLRQSAQIWCSGLQFLVDEFKADETRYHKLEQLLTSDPVQCVEEYISDTQDIPPEYGDVIKIDPTKIPKEYIKKKN
jgi:hypothetical protein